MGPACGQEAQDFGDDLLGFFVDSALDVGDDFLDFPVSHGRLLLALSRPRSRSLARTRLRLTWR